MKAFICPEGHDHTSECRRSGCPCENHKHTVLSELGKLGGSVKSEAKTKAAQINGKKGGRPKVGVSRKDL